MPFKKTKAGKYRSPGGRLMSLGQVKAYYAKQGSKAKKGAKRK